ncbi:AAA family ATPase [Aeromicrobium sp. CnD17-E]|uniref:AAA family ATPase n=1 Tax=Aeromicrobium sp. CnD17-E TaxID=2954487 RepID=UPI00209829ED|nr:AAA family ATPase [Aeromicrobium sp. CnD17-E]MCO7238700.1 AAA family ATPase [Aeromicrobium sp. CnD17-E]
MYDIKIRNCNSIESAALSLTPAALNIKYGPNGIGKSTISRALKLNAEGAEALEVLRPFKYRADPDQPGPEVSGAEAIKTVLVFSDRYVEQFAFQRDEVLKDSFEIFINTDEYKQGIEQIAAMFDELRAAFDVQPAFDEAVLDFTELRDAFSVTKTQSLSKASRGVKALKVGGKLQSVPEPLQGYSNFIQGDNPAAWVAWQAKGQAFLEQSDNCPFCSTPSLNKETARRVSKEYDSAAVKNMSALREVIDRLGSYFDEQDLATLNQITSLLTDPTPEQSKFLVSLHTQVETFLQKLRTAKQVSFHTFAKVNDVENVLRDMEIDLRLMRSLDSHATRSVVEIINGKLQDVADRVGEIKGHIGRQQFRVAGLIRTNQDAINEFLDSAGYRYQVRIEAEADSYRMILEHQDAAGHIESAGDHLSYGEKNAFALVLFMHEVLRKKPDLVVLDDPVSSFDKTKKFAILNQLFQGPGSIRGFTTLLLTHDLEPAIDIVRSVADRFKASNAVVHFLSAQGGDVTEKRVAKEDISTFLEVCVANIGASSDDVIKCIYLRRLFEARGERGTEYDLLSSLLHLRPVPSRYGSTLGEFEPLSAQEVLRATESVKKHFPDFDYDRIVVDSSDPVVLRAKFHATTVGYEKVQLYRVYLELTGQRTNSATAIAKFVNETFHIENEYVMQLNPREYDTVPSFIVAKCAELIDVPTEGEQGG